MNLQDLRQKLPLLKSLSDEKFIDSVHSMYYPEVDKTAFSKALGYSAPEKPVEQAGVLRTAGDVGIKLAQGVVDLGSSAVGVASLATGGLAGKGMRAIGYDPKRTNEILGEYLSDSQKAADDKVAKADGFVDTITESVKNPRSILGGIAQSAPGMLGAMGVTGTVAKGIGTRAALLSTEGAAASAAEIASGKTAAEAAKAALATKGGQEAAQKALENSATKLLLTGSATEGAQTAGQIADDAQAAGRDYSDYALPAAAAGAGTALIGLGSGKLMGDAATQMASGAKSTGVKGNIATRAGKEFLSEGVMEEMPQSAQEQYFTNIAQGEQDRMKGVANAAGSGLIVGGVQGAGMGMLQKHNDAPVKKLPDTGILSRAANAGQESKAALMLENKPDPLISFRDGTVARQSEIDNAMAALPTEEERAAFRAKLLNMNPQQADANAEAGNVPLQKPEHSTQEESDNNQIAFSERNPPISLRHAQAMAGIGRERGINLTVMPHVSGDGYMLLPNHWLSAEDKIIHTPLQKKQEAQQGNGSFSKVDELAGLMQQEKDDANKRRIAAVDNAMQHNEAQLSGEISDADARVADAMQRETSERRSVVLDDLLSSDLMREKSPAAIARAYRNALSSEGFSDASVKPEEFNRIQRYKGINEAISASDADESARMQENQQGQMPSDNLSSLIPSANESTAPASTSNFAAIDKAIQSGMTLRTPGGNILHKKGSSKIFKMSSAQRAYYNEAVSKAQQQAANNPVQQQEPVVGASANEPVQASPVAEQPHSANFMRYLEIIDRMADEGQVITRKMKDKVTSDSNLSDAEVDELLRRIDAVNAHIAFEQEAHQAATSPENDLQEPTEAQKEAGNYKKGHVQLHGLDISIENPQGSKRSGIDRDGTPWENKMEHHYGYIKGTIGADKDHIDAFIGRDLSSDKVFVVDQVHPGEDKFDEHKVMLGFNSLEDARAAYQANYAPGWMGGKTISETTIDGFKSWLKDGNTKNPFSNTDGGDTAKLNLEKNLPSGTVAGDSGDILILANSIAKNEIDAGKKVAIRYSIVSDFAASEIKKVTGIDVSGYKHTVDSSGIRHAFKQHGNEKSESKRGQIAITAEDIAKIPDVISDFDSIENAGQDATGNQLIRYTKNFDGTIFHVEEIRQKRMELVTKTLWKTRNNADMPVKTSDQLTPEATKSNHPQSNLNVNDVSGEVNGIHIDSELSDALSHLGDVLGDVFGAKLNISGAKHGAADLLPALSKVVELMVRKGAKSLKDAVLQSAKAMVSIPSIEPHINRITARQWKAAYNSIAEAHEGTDSEESVAATSADDIISIVKSQSRANSDSKTTISKDELDRLRSSAMKDGSDAAIFHGWTGKPSGVAKVKIAVLDSLIKNASNPELVTSSIVDDIVSEIAKSANAVSLAPESESQAVNDYAQGKRDDPLEIAEVKKELADSKPKSKPKKSSKPESGNYKLRDDFGVPHIDGYAETEDYALKNLSNDIPDGGVKDAFIKDATSYLKDVSVQLDEAGFLPYADSKGKPGKPVRVSEGGIASSGDVSLSMFNEDAGKGIYINITAGVSIPIIPQTKSGVTIMMRVTEKDKPYGGDRNLWQEVNQSSGELTQKIIGLVGKSAAPAEVKAAPTTAPEHQGNEGKALNKDNVFLPSATGSPEVDAPIDESIVPLTMDASDFKKVTDEWADLFSHPEKRVITDQRAKQQGFISNEEAQKVIDGWKAHVDEQYEKHRIDNSDKTILSLFDLSGEWSRPWEEAGYNVIRFDIQNGQDVRDFSVEYFNENYDFSDVYGILAACPCTDFASSGARHFAEKDADGRTEASKELVFQTLRTIEYFRPKIWALENPVGRIESLTGLPKARMTFEPHHFGEDYTKKTMLWGKFDAELPLANVEPTEGSKMHRLYGGKSQATKNARSVTPEGFAYAFFMANNYVDLTPEKRLTGDYPEASGAVRQALRAGIAEDDIRDLIDDYYGDYDYEGARNALIKEVAQKINRNTVNDMTDEQLRIGMELIDDGNSTLQKRKDSFAKQMGKRGIEKTIKDDSINEFEDVEYLDEPTQKQDSLPDEVPDKNSVMPASSNDIAESLPNGIEEAISDAIGKQKERIARLRRDPGAASEKIAEAEHVLRKMRNQIFNAEDAAVKAVLSGDSSAFDEYASLFPKARESISEELDKSAKKHTEIPRKLSDINVTAQVFDGETGLVSKGEMRADEALKAVDERKGILESLIDCMNG